MPGSSLEPLDVGVQIPYHFRCPISLELMRDPVTISTGQTYDRSSIESWVATGNSTCPVTRSPLSDFTLIPNHTLRRLIQEWCVSNRSFGVQRIPTPKQPADPALVRRLLTQSCSDSVLYQTRLSALRRLQAFVRESDKNRSIISSNNASDLLLPIVFTSDHLLPDLAHESLALLVMFPLSLHHSHSIASDPDRISFLASLLSNPSIEPRLNSAALIEMILAATPSAEHRLLIGNAEGLFQGIIQFLNYPFAAYPRALKVGIKALFALCLLKQNRHKAISAGAAQAVVDRLADFEKCDAERALATIELLCRISVGCAAFAAHALTVPLLVKIILKISDRATEYAAGALLTLCSGREELQRDAVAAGVVTQLLLLVQSDCTQRAKRKAQLLLKLLRSSWPDESIANSHDFVGCSDVAPF